MKFIVYQDSRRRWLWRLETARGRVLAYGVRPFESREDCRADIQLVKNCRDARVHLAPLIPVINSDRSCVG